MELIATIEKDLILKDQFILKDGSTWTNPARGVKNLTVFVERFSYNEYIPVEKDKIIANGTTKLATQWTVTIPKDGYYKILLVSSDNHNPSMPYVKNKVVYGATPEHLGLFVSLDDFVPIGTLLTNDYFWLPVESIEDFPMLADSGTDRLCIDHLHDLSSRICIAEKAIVYAKGGCDCPDENIMKDYFWSLLYHHASIYSGAFGEYQESGKFLDQVIDKCTGSAELEKDCGCHD